MHNAHAMTPLAPSPSRVVPIDDPLDPARSALVERVLRHAGAGLVRPAALPALGLYRSDALDGSVCGVYQPSVALILQGRKRVVLGGDTLVYDTRRFLISSLDLPAVATILEASAERPYVAVVLQLDMPTVAELMLEAALPVAAPPATTPRAMATGDVTAPLLDAFRRLIELLDRPDEIAVLAPLVQREILYRLLVSEAGVRLRQIASADTQGHQIARAIERLKRGYAQPLRIEDLAREARMSVSTFHHHFKSLTAMSPLQYQKHLRLNEARRLMLTEHVDAATAAYRVGYESPSQFSREYSRQFGAPPMRDISSLRSRPLPQALAS